MKKYDVKKISGKPVVFWFINAIPEESELRFQIKEMHKHGIGGFFIHWMPGAPGYMSEHWFHVQDIIIDESQKLGMNAWLYDEAWCPSCYAGGRILSARPELQAKTLWSETQDVKGGNTAVINFDLMKILSIVALPVEGGVPQIEKAIDISAYCGPRADALDKPYRHDWGYYPFIKPVLHWRATVKGKLQWELNWSAPSECDWRIYIFCQREMLQWDNFNRLDVLNPESIKCFLKETHEKYAKRFSKFFGTVIPGIMTDEYKYLPAPWTDRLPEYYQTHYNTDLLKLLPALVDESIPESRIIKANYHSLISDLFVEFYTLPMKDWCDKHQLILTGHISPEEHGGIEIKFAGNIAAHIKHFDMPGADIIIHEIGDREHAVLNLSPRLATSVAHQQGISKVFVEAGACGNEDLSLEDYKYLFDWLMIHGINFINIHAIAFSLSGYEKFLAGQAMDSYGNLQQHFDILADYIEERCDLFTEYRPNPKVAVLKPMAALRACAGIYEPDTENEFIDRALTETVMTLVENHIDFDLLNEDDADSWLVNIDTLIVGVASYEIIIIPYCGLIASGAYEKLEEISNGGGAVICCQELPDIISHTEIMGIDSSSGFIIVENASAAVAEIKEKLVGDIVISGVGTDSIQIFTGHNSTGEKLCFLLNTGKAKVCASLAAENESVEVELLPRESKIIRLPFDEVTGDIEKKCIKLEFDNNWQVEAVADNHLPLTAGMNIVLEDGAVVDYLIYDVECPDAVKNSFTINGASPDWEGSKHKKFYTVDNMYVSVEKLFTIGENSIDFDDNALPTLLLSGSFSAFIDGDTVILKSPITTIENVSRLDSGYPYLRGELIFTNTFTLEDLVTDTKLALVDRKGSVEVIIDGESKGLIAWQTDGLGVGDLSAGEHSIVLKVIGDGIGILREGYNEAGCSSISLCT